MHQVEVATTQETLLDNPEMILNMGPQHPSTHGVLRIILRLDGETVIDLDCDIGFLHRGMEKIAENRLYPMIAPYWDRLDYIAAVSNGLVWVETVEQMLGLEIPPRAHYIRTILTELNRIASHLLWLATHGLDIGAFTVLLWALREREEILKIFEQQFGARLTCHAWRIGGMPNDTHDGFTEDGQRFRAHFPERPKIPKVVKPPAGDSYHSFEGPKGETGCSLVSDGTSRPYRVRVRPPCLINLQALRQMCIGHLIADVVAIIGTLDIVLGEIDR